MERGLLWLPLLIVLIWLTWSGWNEYQKLETYNVWAEDFDNAKYDIYAVLGKKDRQLTWGKPTRQGVIDLETFSLDDVRAIELLVDERASDLENLPDKGKPALKFNFSPDKSITIPFTDIALAAKWLKYLQNDQSYTISQNE
jgi:hypothetical protein